MPRVAVITPNYETPPERLERCLAGVQAQTFADFEHIVIDDGSTIFDPAAVVSRHLKARLLPLKANGGRSSARNAGIKSSDSEFVAFLDADDAWEPQMLQRQIAALEDKTASLVSTDCRIRLPGGEYADKPLSRFYGPLRRFRPPQGDFLEHLVVYNSIRTSTVMTARSRLEEVGLFDPAISIGEDWDLWIRLAKTGPLRFIPEPLGIYSFNDDPGSWQADGELRLRAAERVLERAFADGTLERRFGTALRERARSQTHFEIGAAQLVRGRPAQARRHFARCLALTPARLSAYVLLAFSLAPEALRASLIAWRNRR